MKLADCKQYDIVKTTRTREDGKPVFGQLGQPTPGLVGGPTPDGEIEVTYGYMNEYTDWVKPEELTEVPEHPRLDLEPLPAAATPMYAAVTPAGEIIGVEKHEHWAYNAAINRYCDDFSVPRDITYGCAQVDREAATWLGYRVYLALVFAKTKSEYTITLYSKRSGHA